MARRNRSSIRKERIIMLASSVFVLAALTVTGVYVRNNNRAEKEDYVVDFEALEHGSEELAENMVEGEELDTLFAGVGTDDLDYDPNFQEANSLHVENTENENDAIKKTGEKDEKDMSGLSKSGESDDKEVNQEEDEKLTSDKKKDDPVKESADKKTKPATDKAEEEEEAGMFDETVDTAMSGEVQTEGIAATVQPELDFNEEDGLVWPIVGDVLINYSMDKTIYFPTLQQLGNGYELTYGQLENITVSEGSYVHVGDGIGTVAAPTKYYSMEGTNVYFKLTKDGQPVNPMSKLN